METKMAKFVVAPTSNGQYQFTLRADNGETMLTSETYVNEQGAQNGVASVKANAPDDDRYDRRTSTNGQPYFVLKSANGEPLATSELYSSTNARDDAIEVVKRIAPSASLQN
jgi:uncharacterized protein YegP (UPF0339 family)